jgi:hypothetical protein
MKTIKITLPIKITSSNNKEGDISAYIITDVNDTEYFFLKQEGTEELLYDGICVNIPNNMDLSTNELPNGNDFFQNKEQDKKLYSEVEIIEILMEYDYSLVNEGKLNSVGNINKWFEQFKKK